MNQANEAQPVNELPAGREGFHLSTFRGNDFYPLIELSETTYPGREISHPEYLEWEYKNNPDGTALINVIEKSGKPVSQYIILPRSFSIKNKIYKGSLSVNTLTHPAFRGKEFFRTLAERTFNQCKDSGILFTIGFPNPVSLPVIARKKILQVTGNLPLLFLPIRPMNIIFNYLKARKDMSGAEIKIPLTHTGYDKEISIFDFEKDALKFDSLVKEFNRDKEIVTHRSLEFFNWRYEKIPLRHYSILKMEENKRITAVAVFRARNVYGLRCGILIDLISVSHDPGKLVRAIRKISSESKLDILISTVTPHSDEFLLLKRAGFFNAPGIFLPRKLAFITRLHHGACPADVSDFNKWYLTFGDYDIF